LRWLAWIPAFGYMALIFGLSSISHVPELPFHPSDKLLHVILYSGLGSTILWGLTDGGRRNLGWRLIAVGTLLAALYGVGDEVHQRFVPGRSFEVGDMVADLAGGFLGALAVALWRRHRAQRAVLPRR
jgi:VanZ family protein